MSSMDGMTNKRNCNKFSFTFYLEQLIKHTIQTLLYHDFCQVADPTWRRSMAVHCRQQLFSMSISKFTHFLQTYNIIVTVTQLGVGHLSRLS